MHKILAKDYYNGYNLYDYFRSRWPGMNKQSPSTYTQELLLKSWSCGILKCATTIFKLIFPIFVCVSLEFSLPLPSFPKLGKLKLDAFNQRSKIAYQKNHISCT